MGGGSVEEGGDDRTSANGAIQGPRAGKRLIIAISHFGIPPFLVIL